MFSFQQLYLATNISTIFTIFWNIKNHQQMQIDSHNSECFNVKRLQVITRHSIWWLIMYPDLFIHSIYSTNLLQVCTFICFIHQHKLGNTSWKTLNSWCINAWSWCLTKDFLSFFFPSIFQHLVKSTPTFPAVNV